MDEAGAVGMEIPGIWAMIGQPQRLRYTHHSDVELLGSTKLLFQLRHPGALCGESIRHGLVLRP